MEDRRVIKTKKNLKATLIEMMGEISFEQISITELCKRAEIRRITFYAHYSDKYALADDIFSDMLQIGTDIYRTKQEKENPTECRSEIFPEENCRFLVFWDAWIYQ